MLAGQRLLIIGPKNINMDPHYITKKQKLKPPKRTHVLIPIFILTLILIIKIINKFSNPECSNTAEADENSTTSKLKQLEAIHALAIFRNTHKKNILFNSKLHNSQKILILLLILLSNDVNPNPGPKPNPEPNPVNPSLENPGLTSSTSDSPLYPCTMCKEEIHEEASLQCSSCQQWCHLKCTGNTEYRNLKERKFEWICPIKTCSPNHNEAIYYHNLVVSPNRYTIPQITRKQIISIATNSNVDKIPVSNNRNCNKPSPTIDNNLMSEMTKITPEDYIGKEPCYLMSEMTKITPKEYIGKELCSSCYKEVKDSDKSILCDSCERWIHRKCSDMTLKYYRENEKKRKFSWICNVCRKDDDLITDKPIINILKENEMPELLEAVERNKNEILILNINFRSVLNKEEQLEYICSVYDPDIICATETWMEDSVPAKHT